MGNIVTGVVIPEENRRRCCVQARVHSGIFCSSGHSPSRVRDCISSPTFALI
jgi:hypothetical protein